MSVGAPDAIRWDKPIGGRESGRESERWSVILGKFQVSLLFSHALAKSLRSRGAAVNQKSWVLIITTRKMTSTVIETNDMTNVYRAMRARWS